jgi:hypothetical protein
MGSIVWVKYSKESWDKYVPRVWLLAGFEAGCLKVTSGLDN